MVCAPTRELRSTARADMSNNTSRDIRSLQAELRRKDRNSEIEIKILEANIVALREAELKYTQESEERRLRELEDLRVSLNRDLAEEKKVWRLKLAEVNKAREKDAQEFEQRKWRELELEDLRVSNETAQHVLLKGLLR